MIQKNRKINENIASDVIKTSVFAQAGVFFRENIHG